MCWICRRTRFELAAISGVGNDKKHTRQHKQNDEVNNQHRPEHGNVEDGQPGTDETNGNGTGGRVPELELRQAADEGSELLVLLGGEAGGALTILETLVLSEGRIEFGGQEGKE